MFNFSFGYSSVSTNSQIPVPVKTNSTADLPLNALEQKPLVTKDDFITHMVESIENNQSIHSMLSVARLPLMQAYKISQPSIDISSLSFKEWKEKIEEQESALQPLINPHHHASSLSFQEWTEEMQESASQVLHKLGVPLEKITLNQIYQLIKSNQETLCANPSVAYPALFQAKASYEGLSSASTTPLTSDFYLEIHNKKKISLIFINNLATRINDGTYKKWIKAFPLGKPKTFAYSYSFSADSEMNRDIMERENTFIKMTKDQSPYIAKVHEIFYYKIAQSQKTQLLQVITMKYYPQTLLSLIDSLPDNKLPDQNKIKYSIQIIEAVLCLHKQGILHRDLKPENILLSDKGTIGLTDYGRSCLLNNHSHDSSEAAGTVLFMAPEGFTGKPKGAAYDTWSVACILYQLWADNGKFPWFDAAGQARPNFLNLSAQMSEFDFNQPSNELKKLSLLWKMLRFDPKNRCELSDVLKSLKEMEKELSEQPTYDFATQFLGEIENHKKAKLARNVQKP